MSDQNKIKTALISVSDKSRLNELAKLLQSHNVKILSTGGTAKSLREFGLDVQDVSDHTGFPEIMDGRVKTLHPAIHGGLLGVLDNEKHLQAMRENNISSIDLVIVNLYPFEESVAKNASFEETIENIDIGGPSMVRSAAKNFRFTTIITDVDDYEELANNLNDNDGNTTLSFRQKMAAKAFAKTASYDTAIANWFAKTENNQLGESFNLSAKLKQNLRYGENPHQKAAFYSFNDNSGIASAEQLHGKELSYNNINDADAALNLVSEFEFPACAIIKHANPCGVAIGDDLFDAYKKALASDPVSAFGGIIAFNQELNAQTASEISNMFVEAIITPRFSDEAFAILSKKKNVRLISTENIDKKPALILKSVKGGVLVQEEDLYNIKESDLKIVTNRKPTANEIKEMLFAFRVCKHVKSNAIVLTKNGASIGIGAGQMSRVDSSRISAIKAGDCKENPNRAQGSTLASDAFFPFKDGVEMAAKAGVSAIIQPGGSIRDEEVIEEANKNNIAMVFTGVRHFRH